MAELVVFRKGVKHVILYDNDMHNLICEYKWCISDNGYATAKNKSTGMKNIRMHRLVLGILDTPSVLCDHKDKNKLNSCISNLRPCNKSENGRNRRPLGKVEYIGVHAVTLKSGIRYIASIHDGEKSITIGSYATKEMAAYARDTFARKIHKEFASLNFPDVHFMPKAENLSRVTRSKSLHKGVYVVGDRFRVQVALNSKRIHVGYFKNIIEAAKAYDVAAVKYQGANAVLNFPEEHQR